MRTAKLERTDGVLATVQFAWNARWANMLKLDSQHVLNAKKAAMLIRMGFQLALFVLLARRATLRTLGMRHTHVPYFALQVPSQHLGPRTVKLVMTTLSVDTWLGHVLAAPMAQ